MLSRREQSLDKKYPGLFKHHASRQSGSTNSMEKLIKKRNVPQKLPSHIKRYEVIGPPGPGVFHSLLKLQSCPLSPSLCPCLFTDLHASALCLSHRPDILKSEVILPKLDSSMTQVTIPSCPNKSSTSPGRSRRGKPRHRKAGKGSSGDLAGLKAALSSSCRDTSSPVTSSPPAKQHLAPTVALRGLQHDLLLKKMSSSSPDLISTTMEAEGRHQRELAGLERSGSLSAAAGLGRAEVEGGVDAGGGADDPTETPPRSDTPSEDAVSIPFSSSPDSPCGRGAAASRSTVLGGVRLPQDGEDKEEGAGISRSPRGSASQHLTPAAILYRAAVTRKQVGTGHPKLSGEGFITLVTFNISNALINACHLQSD